MSLVLFSAADQPDLFPHSPGLLLREGDGLFEGGPPSGLQLRIGLMTPECPHVLRRALLAAGVGWLPLFFLTAFQDAFLHDGSFSSFVLDYGVIGRSLIAAPVLILAESIVAPRLSAIARHFRDAGLVATKDMALHRDAVDSTVRYRDSVGLEVLVCGIAFALAALVALSSPLEMFPAWHRIGQAPVFVRSIAGWWHALVSFPLLVVLLLGWLWRLVLWTRFLWLMSCLDLHLVAAHPDGAAGLKFVGMSLLPLSVIAFALGAIIAGTVANRVAHDHLSILSYRAAPVWLLAVVIVLLAGPLLVFTRKLMTCWQHAVFEYGTLARSVGRQMERSWLNRPVNLDALQANDFSATTDLYSITSNVYAMNIVPVGLKNLAVVAAGTLLPFLPVVLMSVSPEVLFEKLKGFLL